MTVWNDDLTRQCGRDCVDPLSCCRGGCIVECVAESVPFVPVVSVPLHRPDAENECPECGAPSGGFRAFCLLFVAVSMLVCGIAMGFGLGIWWHSHLVGGAK